MEQSKRELEVKQERLIKELEQIDLEIANVDNKLSQLPLALQQLEAEKQEQSRQTCQLYKSIKIVQVLSRLTSKRFRMLMIFACVRSL